MSEDFPFSIPFIRWASVSYVTTDRPLMPRRLYDHEFIYVLTGTGKMIIEGRTLRAEPDRLFLIQPRQWHSFLADTDSAMDLIGIHFDWISQHDSLTFPVFVPADDPVDETRFRQPLQIPYWNLETQPILDLKGHPRVRRALEETIAEFGREEAESRGIAGALLAAAIQLMATEARHILHHRHGQHSGLGADALRRARRAREMLESLELPPPTIEDVAQKIGWTADHLRRVFRDAFGVSPYHVQTAARLNHAKLLLRSENLSIAEIAARCGFDDASHFARVFKKESGFSPRQFLMLVKRM